MGNAPPSPVRPSSASADISASSRDIASLSHFTASDLLEEVRETAIFDADAEPSELTDLLPEPLAPLFDAFTPVEHVREDASGGCQAQSHTDTDSPPPILNSAIAPAIPTISAPSSTRSSISTSRILDSSLSSLLVSSVVNLAHDPRVGGCQQAAMSGTLESHWARLRRLHAAIERETLLEHTREEIQHRRAKSRARTLCASESEKSPNEELSGFAMASAASMIAELLDSHTVDDKSQPRPLWDLLATVIQAESFLSLSNGLASLDSRVSEALEPIFDVVRRRIKQLASDSLVDRTTLSAMDSLVALAMARGSLSAMMDVMELCLQHPALSIARHILARPSQHFKLDSAYQPQPGSDRVGAMEAVCVLLSAMAVLALRVRPLLPSLLPLSSSSPLTCNPNQRPILYHPFAIQTDTGTIERLSSIIRAMIGNKSDIGSDSESEVRALALKHAIDLLSVHLHELSLSNDRASMSACYRAHALYPLIVSLLHDLPPSFSSVTPSKSSLHSTALSFLSFTQSFFFPSLAEQLQVLHRLFADWHDAESNPTSPSNTQMQWKLTTAVEREVEHSASQSQRTSILSTHLPSEKHFASSLSQSQLMLLSPGSLVEPRDAMTLRFTRLLLTRFDCFTGSRMIVDALYESHRASDRDSAAELVKDLLTFLHYEIKQRMRSERDILDRDDELQDTDTKTELAHLFSVSLSLVDRIQVQLLSRQAAIFARQDEDELARKLKARQQQDAEEEREMEEAMEEGSASVSESDSLSRTHSTPVTSRRDSLSRGTPTPLDGGGNPQFTRSHSLILCAPPSFSPVDYFHYHASSLLQTCASLMCAAYEIHKLTTNAHSRASTNGDAVNGFSSLMQLLHRLALPLVLATSSFISPSRASLSTQLLRSMAIFCEQLTRLNRVIGLILTHSPSGTDTDSVTVSRRYESLHPYRPFTDEYLLLSLPPHGLSVDTTPRSLSLSFDLSLCYTASKYDYVQLFALHPYYAEHRTRDRCVLTQEATGSDSAPQPLHDSDRPLSEKFYGDRFPTDTVTFHSQHVVLHFHSGSSHMVDSAKQLGFGVSVTTVFDNTSENSTVCSPAWLSSLVHLSIQLSASLCSSLVCGFPTSEAEITSQSWLSSSLIEGGFDRSSESDSGNRSSESMFLSDLFALDGLTATAASPSAAALLVTKLRAANIDRSIVQRSIAAACQAATQQVFACLLKLTDRVSLAIECAERADSRIEPDLVKLWRRACEIKMDLRSQQDKTQDVSQLVDDIRRRCAFLLTLQSSAMQLQSMQEAKEAQMPAKLTLDLIRRQSSVTNNITNIVNGNGVSIPVSMITMAADTDSPPVGTRADRPQLEKRASVWSKAKLMGAMMKGTIKTMKTLKSLMQIRTRAVDAHAGNSDAIDSAATAAFELVREKANTSKLLVTLQAAMVQQRQRAEHRIVGLQAVRQMATKLLALRSITDTDSLTLLRPDDEPLRLAELFVAAVSRALRSDEEATGSGKASSRSTHILAQIDSAGLELKGFVFNEFFAFLSLFLDYHREHSLSLSSSLSSTCRLHLIHLCLSDLNKEDAESSNTLAASFFSRSHSLLALYRIGALTLIARSQPLLVQLLDERDSEQFAFDVSLPWSLQFSSWSMLRCLLYAATDALEPSDTVTSSGGMVDDDSANEVHAIILDQLSQQIQRNQSLARSSQISSLYQSGSTLSLSDASVAYHLNRLRSRRSWRTLQLLQSPSLGRGLPPPPPVTATPSPRELHEDTCELLFAVFRSAQSSMVRARLAASADWIPALVQIIVAPVTDDDSISSLTQFEPLNGAVIARILAIRLLASLIKLIHPTSPHFMKISDSLSLSPLSALFAIIAESQRSGALDTSPCPLHVSRLLASELVSLVRSLLASSHWSQWLSNMLQSKIDNIRATSVSLSESEWCEAVAALWIVGGGSPWLGECARVSFLLQNELRTGTVVKTLASKHKVTANDDPDTLEAVYEVLVDDASEAAEDDWSHTAPKPTPNSTRSIYPFYASSLTPIDAVSVPLLSFTASAARDIVSAIVSQIRVNDASSARSVVLSMNRMFDTMATEAVQDNLPAASDSTLPTDIDDGVLSSPVHHAKLHYRCLKALNVLLLRDDLAHLALELGVGPHLVPLACEPLTTVMKGGSDSESFDDSDVILIELESRSSALMSIIDRYRRELPHERDRRLHAWTVADAARAAERARRDAEKRLEDEKRAAEDAKIPALVITDSRHPQHPLVYHPRVPYMSGVGQCDGCQDRETRSVYHCAMCRFDLCLRCIEPTLAPILASHTTSTPLFPPSLMFTSHSHPLEFASSVYDSRFNCNECGVDKSGAVYHCGQCQYDACIACAAPLIADNRHRQEQDSEQVVSEMVTTVTSSDSSLPSSSPKPSSSQRASSHSVDLTLLGFPKSRCESCSRLADSAAASVSKLLDELDATNPDVEAKLTGSSMSLTAQSLVPVSYWPITYKYPEGIEKIRAFMANFTESSSDFESGGGVGAGNDIELIVQTRKRATASIDHSDDKEVRNKERKQSSQRFAPSLNDFEHLPMAQVTYAVDHDPEIHRKEFAAWRSVFLTHIIYHRELPQLVERAQLTDRGLARLYARRCLLSLLHLLKDQIRAEQPIIVHHHGHHGHSASFSMTSSPFASSRGPSPLSSPYASPRMTVPSISSAQQSPSLRSLRHASPASTKRTLGLSSVNASPVATLAVPASPVPLRASPSARSSTLGSHSLASIGPPGFLAPFLALLCSAPHQLTIPQQSSHLDVISGGGGQAGLRNLGDIVHTILLAEKQSLELNVRGLHVTQREFSRCAPISRHLLSDACVRMLQLCKPDREIERHALINTVIYIFEAFMALEEARPAAQPHHRHKRLASIYGSDSDSMQTSSASKSNLMLSLIFTVPVFLLMLACISEARSPPSSSVSSAPMTTSDIEFFAAMDRQRLVFARLAARVLALKTKHMEEANAVHILAPSFIAAIQQHGHHAHSLSLPTSSAGSGGMIAAQQSWYRIFNSRLLSLPLSVLTVMENELMCGQRGLLSGSSMPYSFFCAALVDLALIADKFRKRLFTFAPHLIERWQRYIDQSKRDEEEDIDSEEKSSVSDTSPNTSDIRNISSGSDSHHSEHEDFMRRIGGSRARSSVDVRTSPSLSPYASNLLSSPATPVAHSGLPSPMIASSIGADEDGNTSSISLTDIGSSMVDESALFASYSPLALALSQLPATPDISISFSLASSPSAIQRELSFERRMETVEDSFHEPDDDDSNGEVVDGRSVIVPLSSPAVFNDDEERRRSDHTNEFDASSDETSPVAQTLTALLPASAPSAEERAKQAARKARQRSRDARLWFARLTVIDATLTYLRSRATPTKHALDFDDSSLSESIDFDIEEESDDYHEEVRTRDEDDEPALRRTKSVEERAPLPIIPTSASTVAPDGKKRDCKDDATPQTPSTAQTPTVSHITITAATPPNGTGPSGSPVLTPVRDSPFLTPHYPHQSHSLLHAHSPLTSMTSLSLHTPDPATPSDMLDMFYESTQEEIFQLASQQRLQSIALRIREEEERIDATTELQALNTAPSSSSLTSEISMTNVSVANTSEWACPRCTFLNSPLAMICDLCDCSNPTPSALSLISATDADACVYFELTVLSLGRQGAIGIGLSCPGYSHRAMPGWENGGYGWHGDDGKVFGGRSLNKEYGPRWQEGDTVGCGLYLRRREIFFTLNGEDQGVAFTDVPLIDYYACAGFHSPGESVSLNMGQLPFKYQSLPPSHVVRPDVTWQSASQSASVGASNLFVTSSPLAVDELPSDPINVLTMMGSVTEHIQTTSLLIRRGRASPVHARSVGYVEATVDSDSETVSDFNYGLSSRGEASSEIGGDDTTYELQTSDGVTSSRLTSGPFCAPLSLVSGDTVGVGYDRAKREIFFTKNNTLLGVAFDRVYDPILYPSFVLRHGTMRLSLNFGQSPFVYQPMNDGCVLTTKTNGVGAYTGPLTVDNSKTVVQFTDDTSATDASEPTESVAVFCTHEPIIPKIELQLTLEREAAAHSLLLQPRSYWARIEGLFGVAEDEALAALINRRCEKDDGALSSLHRVGTFSMTAEEKVLHSCLTVSNITEFDLQLRLAFLLKLNELLGSVVQFTNLSRPSRRSTLAKHFHDPHIRAIFLYPFKSDLLRQALSSTSFVPDHTQQRQPFQLKLDLFSAQKLLRSKKCDVSGDKSLFGQAFHTLYRHRHREENKYGDHDTDPTRWFLPIEHSRPWKVVFTGLYADDYGGLFRDSLDRMCRELQSPVLNLFIPTPNAREQIGANRHHFVPNPSAVTPLELDMFKFLGQLMGMAIRTGELLFLDLPAMVWKPLVDESITETDVMEIDRLSFSLVHELRKLELSIGDADSGLTEDTFNDYIDCAFIVVGSDGVERDLVPDGSKIPVTWDNRQEFVQALISYRKQEFHRQCSAIKEGLASVVPIAALSCFRWEQLRAQVCGQATIDVALLRSMTVYEGCQPSDAHIQAFWRCLEQRFSETEKANLLQFVNGSSRLPNRQQEFERRFKLQHFYPSSNQSNPDDYLPVAHTCFFSLELPAYSSIEVLHQRLLYAITHCQAIDADSTDAARASGRMVGVVDSDEED